MLITAGCFNPFTLPTLATPNPSMHEFRLRSPSRSHHRLAGGSDISLSLAADTWSGQRVGGKGDSGAAPPPTPSDGVMVAGGGGYVGSLDKVQMVSKKLFKRSELAMIGQPDGNAAGFTPCHFKVKWYIVVAF